MKSSFVRKGKGAPSNAADGSASSSGAPSLPTGTRLSPHNGSLQVSSGLSDFDDILSGGLLVGSLMIVEEDVYSDYNQLLLRYFAAEAIACKQQLFVSTVSTEEEASEKWIRKLPFISAPPPSQSSLSSDSSSSKIYSSVSSGPSTGASSQTPTQHSHSPVPADIESTPSSDIKIAWQYKKYLEPGNSEVAGSTIGASSAAKQLSWCHSYDMMKTMEAKYISEASISSLSLTPSSKVSSKDDCYKMIFDRVIRLIQANNEILAKENRAIVTKICLPSLGSIVCRAMNAESEKRKFLEFLRALRGLLRQSLATCVISFPAHLYSKDPIYVQRVRHLADSVVQFSAFSDSSEEVGVAFSDFEGLFSVLKLPRLSSLSNMMPSQPTFTFQFKRKKLAIEKIHLPPDTSILEDKNSKSPTHSHSSSASGLLCAPGKPGASNPLDF